MPALANPPLGLNACRFGGRWVNPRADPVQTRGRIRLQHPEPAVVCLTSGGWTRTSGVRVLRELRRIIANCNYSRHLPQNYTVAFFRSINVCTAFTHVSHRFRPHFGPLHTCQRPSRGCWAVQSVASLGDPATVASLHSIRSPSFRRAETNTT